MSKDSLKDACNYFVVHPPLASANTWGVVVSAAFTVCAAASGLMFWRWYHVSSSGRARIWKHYGLFCGLMCCGSCAGAVSHAVWSQFLLALYPGLQDSSIESYLSMASALRWLAAYAVTHPFAFCLLVVAKLLVLNRMLDYSQLKSKGSFSRWSFFFRVLIASVVVGNVAGLCGNIAAATFFVKAANSEESYIAKNLRNSSSTILNAEALDSVYSGIKSAAVFFGFETIILPLIVVALLAAGVVGMRRIRAALNDVRCAQLRTLASVRGSSAESLDGALIVLDRVVSSGVQLKRQIFVTCFVVFIAFILRAFYTSMFSISMALQSSPANCDTYQNVCSDCYNVHYFLALWLLYTPDFFNVVTLMSQPIALLVALWGMTSGQTLDIMKNGRELSNAA